MDGFGAIVTCMILGVRLRASCCWTVPWLDAAKQGPNWSAQTLTLPLSARVEPWLYRESA